MNYQEALSLCLDSHSLRHPYRSDVIYRILRQPDILEWLAPDANPSSQLNIHMYSLISQTPLTYLTPKTQRLAAEFGANSMLVVLKCYRPDINGAANKGPYKVDRQALRILRASPWVDRHELVKRVRELRHRALICAPEPVFEPEP